MFKYSILYPEISSDISIRLQAIKAVIILPLLYRYYLFSPEIHMKTKEI